MSEMQSTQKSENNPPSPQISKNGLEKLARKVDWAPKQPSLHWNKLLDGLISSIVVATKKLPR